MCDKWKCKQRLTALRFDCLRVKKTNNLCVCCFYVKANFKSAHKMYKSQLNLYRMDARWFSCPAQRAPSRRLCNKVKILNPRTRAHIWDAEDVKRSKTKRDAAAVITGRLLLPDTRFAPRGDKFREVSACFGRGASKNRRFLNGTSGNNQIC